MNTDHIVEQLKQQRDSIETAIAALNGTGRTSQRGGTMRKPMSASARAKIAKAQRKRWREQRAAEKK